ncbi:phosphatidylinositol 4-phosphate 5-kinase-like [Microplitis mediator]|uniref:phosphatidylinositol 4-phosphate 5-kinase-like n=1 Tax=Microplitis mediator TaxID=375433 RepID=UPI002554B079|nr:phosphatidylinositol 4-phosphate 5-kinase-like [Microplitis mediator]
MYAYVKLISSDKFTTVDINQIKYYKENRPNKIFRVKIKGEYHNCLVIATHESIDELHNIINSGRRVKVPSRILLSEPSEDEKTSYKKELTAPDNTLDILNKRLSAVNKGRFTAEKDSMASNARSVEEIGNNDSKKPTPLKRKKSNETHSPVGLKTNENPIVNPKKIKKEPKLPKDKKISVVTDTSHGKKITLVQNEVQCAERLKILQEQTNKVINVQSPSVIPSLNESPPPSCSYSLETYDESETFPISPVKTYSGKVDDSHSCLNEKFLEKPEAKSIKSMTQKVKKKHHKPSKVEEEISAKLKEMTGLLKDLKQESDNQKKMLQQLLDYWNEHRDTPSNLESIQLEKKTGFPQPGFYRKSDDTGEDELMSSSLYGEKSNKIKQAEQKPPLCPKRLHAIRDILRFHLEQQKVEEPDIEKELKKVDLYIRSKITDLRSSKRAPKKKTKETAKKKNEEPDGEGSDIVDGNSDEESGSEMDDKAEGEGTEENIEESGEESSDEEGKDDNFDEKNNQENDEDKENKNDDESREKELLGK